jgi:hypothetical protein
VAKEHAEAQVRDQNMAEGQKGLSDATLSMQPEKLHRTRQNNEPHRSRTALRSSLVREVSELQADLMGNGGAREAGEGGVTSKARTCLLLHP